MVAPAQGAEECLADLCGVVGCPGVGGSGGRYGADADRIACERLFVRCVPPGDGPGAAAAHEELVRMYCAAGAGAARPDDGGVAYIYYALTASAAVVVVFYVFAVVVSEQCVPRARRRRPRDAAALRVQQLADAGGAAAGPSVVPALPAAVGQAKIAVAGPLRPQVSSYIYTPAALRAACSTRTWMIVIIS